jgi:hypothetical protein
MAVVALVGCTSNEDVLDRALGPSSPRVSWPAPPSTLLEQSGGTTMTLTVGDSFMPCPADKRGYGVSWDIGDAVPGTGQLNRTGNRPHSVPDKGRNLWCDALEPHSWTLTAQGPAGPASRTVTF